MANGTQMTAARGVEHRIDPVEIRNLLTAAGPCITIVVPGGETAEMRRSIKNALLSIRREIKADGLDELLGPIVSLQDEIGGDPKPRGALMILRSPDVFVNFHVDRSVKERVVTGERFDLRALLSAAAAQRDFYLLALSQKRTRVLHCTNEMSEELALPPQFPTSLEAAMQTRQPDHVLDNKSSAGPSTGSMKGVMFGTSTDREAKDEYLLHFFSEIDKNLHAMLRGSDAPVVPAGVEYELALYSRVNTYPRLVDPGVQGAPDGLDGAELHQRALLSLEEDKTDPRRKALENFDKKIGTGHASVHIKDIVAAAHEGRVSHLFFQESAHFAGAFDPIRQRVKRSDAEAEVALDLVDDAAVQTILHGGEAFILEPGRMPNGVDVCALFRYPAGA